MVGWPASQPKTQQEFNYFVVVLFVVAGKNSFDQIFLELGFFRVILGPGTGYVGIINISWQIPARDHANTGWKTLRVKTVPTAHTLPLPLPFLPAIVLDHFLIQSSIPAPNNCYQCDA